MKVCKFLDGEPCKYRVLSSNLRSMKWKKCHYRIAGDLCNLKLELRPDNSQQHIAYQLVSSRSFTPDRTRRLHISFHLHSQISNMVSRINDYKVENNVCSFVISTNTSVELSCYKTNITELLIRKNCEYWSSLSVVQFMYPLIIYFKLI